MKPANSTRRRWLITISGVLCFVVLGFIWHEAAYFRLRLKPAELFVHVESLPWQSVTIQSANLPSSLHFEPADGEVKVTPIAHGVYRIGIRLATNQIIWSEYFHCDAGLRRRVDIFVTPASNHLHFHQTYNQVKDLFDGDVRPEDVTEQNPFRLSWI